MIIEPYSEQYQDDVIQLIKEFYQEALSEYSTGLNEDSLKAVIEQHKDNSFLLIVEGKCQGMLAGITVNPLLNHGKIYQEIVWYVNKQYRYMGVMFLKKAQEMLKHLGYTQMIMAVMHNSKLDKLYRFYHGQGFKPMETHFVKTF